MALSNKQKEKISIEVIKTLVTRFESFPEDASNNRNAPFHESFLKAFSDKLDGKVLDIPFFISLSSWFHGLSGTLGMTFFENVSHHLSNGEKREYTSKRLGNLLIKQSQRDHIAKIIADLSNTTSTPDLKKENALLFAKYNEADINAMDFSADVFIEDATSVIAIELKSVKPNSGEMKGEKQKILEGKAALYNHFPGKQINFYIGFPFDPTVNPADEPITSHNKPRFLSSIINMNKYFAADETLVANELWDLLSDQENTMEEILAIINTVSTTSFLEKFQFLSDGANRTKPAYIDQLTEWYLYSEIELIINNSTIIQKIENDKAFTKIYNKNPLDSKGNYDFERYYALKELI
ncbi:MAG: TdeIII family type II restriction endonuclease [Sphingobacteriales bacterium]|nr:MAG: TdeIII family type II restriction endonuclease [Sphingobacteriales bacterium]